jgi:hypothetical protein
MQARRELESLRMARVRVEQQMAATRNERYRQLLKMELEAINETMKRLQAAE